MVEVRTLCSVTSDELERFFGKDVMERIELLTGKKVIAGGAALAFYTKKAFHTDVDVFVLDSKYEYDYAITDEPGLQICYTKAKTIEELLEGFPLSISQIAIDLDTRFVVATPACLEAIEKGIVVVDVTKFFSEQHLEKHTVKWLKRLWGWMRR